MFTAPGGDGFLCCALPHAGYADGDVGDDYGRVEGAANDANSCGGDEQRLHALCLMTSWRDGGNDIL